MIETAFFSPLQSEGDVVATTRQQPYGQSSNTCPPLLYRISHPRSEARATAGFFFAIRGTLTADMSALLRFAEGGVEGGDERPDDEAVGPHSLQRYVRVDVFQCFGCFSAADVGDVVDGLRVADH